jgi:hypothetical protein
MYDVPLRVLLEERWCVLCGRPISPVADQLSEITEKGDAAHYHLPCWDSIVRSDLLITEDIRIDETSTLGLPRRSAPPRE